MSSYGRSRDQAREGAQGKTAYDFRDRLQPITGWSDDDLRQLPIWHGQEFDANEIYFNLNLPEVGPFRPSRGDRPLPGYLYVAKADVPDRLWLRLIDGWGTELQMGNLAPQPGAFGRQGRGIRVGYGSTGSEDAGGTPTESS